MRILLDQGTPAPLRKALAGHVVVTVHELGWSTLRNGDLLRRAEADGFGLLVTTDKNIRFQQSLDGRAIGVLVLPTTTWPVIRLHVSAIAQAVESALPGSYVELQW